MQKTDSFTIYNASAGSGKTFTLVKEYLKVLLKSKNPEYFKHILAITFTNKAVGEMKGRIIETLKQFSSDSILKEPNDMFMMVLEELQMTPEVLQKKSKSILNAIIFNYSAFNISTIDGFTHRLIQTFAHDLKVPLNFEVELDTDSIISEAVDRLIDKTGVDKTLTKILVDFAIEKADDDKSWDVAYDFKKIAQLLVNENNLKYIETLKGKTVDDFKNLKSLLKENIKIAENNIKQKAQSVLSLIEQSGLDHADFSRKTLPNHFIKASSLELDRLYDNQLESNLSENKGVYNKTLDAAKASIIDTILPQIGTLYLELKSHVFEYKLLKAVYKNITPLSVLNAINNELSQIKHDESKMLISEFNSIIGNEIKNQPTPFIYERIGEKFHHYFIDEFQDTSVLQWENLIPLLDNSLASENGTAMLVGDAKQSIYRWRGGKAEQFIDLYNKIKRPFAVEQQISSLETNYRSTKEIVNFNNHFFNYLSNSVFSNIAYQELYANANQIPSNESKGYISLQFLDINKDEDRDFVYPEQVYKTLLRCLENKYEPKDICVLVRKKKEGVAIADFLNEKGLPLISSETLLIYNCEKVVFIIDLLKLLLKPNDLQTKAKVLSYLAETYNIKDKHSFFETHIHLDLDRLSKNLNIVFNLNSTLVLPIYDMVEEIVRAFNLVTHSDAYIQFFLDTVLDYSQRYFADLEGFLDYFENKKGSLSITTPEEQNAIQIMTVHKAKGLEFPIVIFPYADLNIYREIEPKEWFPLESRNFTGFSHALLNFNSDFENYGLVGSEIYNDHRSKQELDNINLLYVALTRPIEQLFIISKNETGTNNKTYSGLFLNYLQNLGVLNATQNIYEFGKLRQNSKEKEKDSAPIKHIEFISNAKQNHFIKIVSNSGYLWNTEQQEAIEKGNLVHNIMAKIKTKRDIEFVLNDYLQAATINQLQARLLKDTIINIVEHPQLEMYFNENDTVINERDIISKHGDILRPDKLVINTNKDVVIIDYKTGEENETHKKQLQTYQDILETMGYRTAKKILVYINNAIQVKEI